MVFAALRFKEDSLSLKGEVLCVDVVGEED
jgi:hypothetical protein